MTVIKYHWGMVDISLSIANSVAKVILTNLSRIMFPLIETLFSLHISLRERAQALPVADKNPLNDPAPITLPPYLLVLFPS